MATIHTDNFDGVTAPALPSGWICGAAPGSVYQTETAAFNSAPNGVKNQYLSNNTLMYWNTDDDGNGGDAQASAWFRVGAIGASGLEAYVLCRLTTAAINFTGCTGYVASLDFGTGAVRLARCSGGGLTNLQTVTVSLSSAPESYLLFCRCVGTNIIARVQRLSDSKWLDSAGVWQTGAHDCINLVNAAVSGAGKSGVALFLDDAGSSLVLDDFVFETVPSSGARTQTQAAFF